MHIYKAYITEMRLFPVFLSFWIISCDQNLQEIKSFISADTRYITDTILKGNSVSSKEKAEPDENFQYQTVPFDIKKYYPRMADTASFINNLINNCHLYANEINDNTLERFRKIHLSGSTKDFYFIEYSYPLLAEAEFPARYQIILDDKGKLVKVISAVRVDMVKISPFKYNYLFVLISTAHGNGGHGIYRINKDTLEQIYDGFLGYRPETYNTGYGNDVNIPYELHHKFKDENSDGFNDLVFFGKVRYSKMELGTHNKISPIKFIFLYNKANGHFIEKEDYSEKYKFIYGDTK